MNGLLMVVFGEQYDELAAHCVVASRLYTSLPIYVLSNLKKRCSKWSLVRDIEFKIFDEPTNINRQYKTSMNEHTPFDHTLYLDCDAIVQRPGLEVVFNVIPNDGLLLNVYGRWPVGHSLPNVYRRAFINAGIGLPLTIYYGAFLGFSKGPDTDKFFSLWNTYWKDNGSGREMPSLACAVKNSNIDKKELCRHDGIFSWPINKDSIIQHEYQGYIRNLVGCPNFRSNKFFDKHIGYWN